MRKASDAILNEDPDNPGRDHKYLIYKNPNPRTISSALSDGDMESVENSNWDDHTSASGKAQVFLVSDWDMESSNVDDWNHVHVNNLNPITKVKVVYTPYSYNLTNREGEQR